MNVFKEFKNRKVLGELDAYDTEEVKRLPDNFVPIDAYEQIIQPSIPFICGRKGSGKSALVFMMLPRNFSQPFFLFNDVHMTETLSVELVNLSREETLGLNTQDFFKYFWNYLIYIAGMCSMIYYTFPNTDNDTNQVSGYLQQKTVNIDITKSIELEGFNKMDFPSIVDQMNRLIKHFAYTVYSDAIKMAKNSPSPATTFMLNIQNRLMDDAFLTAKKALLNYLKLTPCTIVIDNVEKCYSENLEYKNSLKGMIECVRDIQQQGIHNLIVKCVIPAEIYEELTYTNPAKYDQRTVFLRWKYKDLLLLVAKRFRKFIEENEIDCKIIPSVLDRKTVREDFWYKLVPMEIRNNQGFFEDSMAYILRHTQKKPRQIINLMNYVIQFSFERNADVCGQHPTVCPIILEEDIKDGIHQEDCMLRSLNDSLSVFSKRDDIPLSMKVRAMFENESTLLSADQIKHFSKRIFDTMTTYFEVEDSDEFLHTLLRSGLVGVFKEERSWQDQYQNKAKYLITEFEYLIQGRLAYGKHLQYGVHEILADALRFDKGKDGAVIYPRPEIDEINH